MLAAPSDRCYQLRGEQLAYAAAAAAAAAKHSKDNKASSLYKLLGRTYSVLQMQVQQVQFARGCCQHCLLHLTYSAKLSVYSHKVHKQDSLRCAAHAAAQLRGGCALQCSHKQRMQQVVAKLYSESTAPCQFSSCSVENWPRQSMALHATSRLISDI
jgi:hypothetical protein